MHRFGPGLVLYWLGFEASLPPLADVAVLHHFPARALFPHSDAPATRLRPLHDAETADDCA